MKCILMVRVSTEKQSYDDQMNELHEIALHAGYSEEEITPVAEIESGIKLDEEERNGLNRMKELIETGEYNCVFAWEISRIARRKKILFSILEYLINRKIQLVIKEPFLHLLKSDGTIDEGAETVFTLYAQLAETEMRNKMARFKRAKEVGYAMGKYEGGKITKGYRVNKDGFWEIDPEGAKFVRMVFNMYISGEYSMTSLARELLSRGYFYNTSIKEEKVQLSLTNVKAYLSHMLKNPMYRGGQSEYMRGTTLITNKNNYPQIIDDETWKQCEKRRKENRLIPKSKNIHLLTPLIHCRCGASYCVNYLEGCYTCRIRHNAVEKGLQHSPNVQGNIIESLAWYVALMELQSDNATKTKEVEQENKEKIAVLESKIQNSEKIIEEMLKRRQHLDEKYFVEATLSEERYKELSMKQDEAIKKEKENIRTYNGQITFLQNLITNAVTFDEMFDSLRGQYDNLKGGTDPSTMRSIIRRYIKDITIEPMEGKLTNFWKIAKIELYNSKERKEQIEQLEAQDLHHVAVTLGTTFYLDCRHHIAYWDQDLKYRVPMVILDRVKATRKDTRKGRKKKPARLQKKQY